MMTFKETVILVCALCLYLLTWTAGLLLWLGGEPFIERSSGHETTPLHPR